MIKTYIMKTQTIFTKDYVLLLDLESEIKGKGWRVDLERKSLGFIDDDIAYNLPHNKDKFALVVAYKKLNPQASDLDLPLLPDWKEEDNILKYINKLANERFVGWNNDEMKGYKTALISISEYVKKAQELSKDKLFTLEDIEKAMLHALHYGFALRSTALRTEEEITKNFIEKEHNKLIIQQLQQSKYPKEFILGVGKSLEEQIKNGKYVY